MGELDRYPERAPTSRVISNEASRVLAGGMTHEARNVSPFPLAIERASGSRKWDPDGNEYVDYVMANGALLLGHGHPAVVEALREQVSRGTHYGAAHRGEVEWAELICRLVPSADRVRFTSSGTEAVMLAVRTARALTGRPKVLKFHHHFHGWSETGLIGLAHPVDIPMSRGLPPGATETTIAVDPWDEEAVGQLLRARDFAAAIVEPSGGRMGQYPLPEGFLGHLRELTTETGTMLVFDEVVTGFRWAPGGAQERFLVNPDLTALGKILGGGLPAGAVAGPADRMELFDIRDPEWTRTHHLFHPGIFNANPLGAAAGIAMLHQVATEQPSLAAETIAAELRSGLREVFERRGFEGSVGGESSIVIIRPGASGESDPELSAALRVSMLGNGVDLLSTQAIVSSSHTPDDIALTVAALDDSLASLQEATPTR